MNIHFQELLIIQLKKGINTERCSCKIKYNFSK